MTRINRVRKEKNFVQLDKGFLQNPKLSAKAKGVLAYILSLPDDWVLYKSELPNHFSDGKDSIRSALVELERFGHLVIEKNSRDEKGKLAHHNITVHEISIHGGLSATGKPLRVNRYGESATTNNDLTKNNKSSSRERIVEHYQKNYGIMPPLVISAIDKFLNDGFEDELIMKAIDVAVERGKKWDYAAGMLSKLRDEHNVRTMEEYQATKKDTPKRHHQKKKIENDVMDQFLTEG